MILSRRYLEWLAGAALVAVGFYGVALLDVLGRALGGAR